MWEMLQYPFFRNAVAGVLIISVAAAVVGTYIVARRLVAMSGGVTHASFGGLGLGYYLGINPVVGAAFVAVFSSLGVEWLSRGYRLREDSAIAVIWALGMAIGIFFVFLTPGYVPELNTYLFGNVLTITSVDLYVFAGYTTVLLAFILRYHRQVLACAFDRDFATVMHVPVKAITVSMTILTALCIVLTIRLVGVMLLMSMLTLPQIISELFCRRFYSMMKCSVFVSIACCLSGLAMSAVINVPCSALIVMTMVGGYIVARILRAFIKMRRQLPVAMVAVLGLLVMSGCSLKKNTAATRNYTAFITRYNIYFNGDEHYKETLKEMERKYEDDYSRLVLMHPAEAFNDPKAPRPEGDFKRSIEKAQKAIQVRSIKKRPKRKAGKSNDPEYKKWLKREEYNPFLHNAWMMMARSQYFGGDFLGAAATFYYVSRHFWWLPNTVTEAKLWQARSYIAIDWLFEAETILNSIKPNEIDGNSTLTGLYNFDRADLNVRQGNYDEAIPFLTEAIKEASGSQKHRLTFLLGQLYQRTGQLQQAYEAFRSVGGASGASYRTKFNARIKQSEVFQGSDITSEVKALKGLLRYGSNKEYFDQIYYAIGNLYLSRADTVNAIDNYRLAVKYSERQGVDKALAQLALGRIYYNQGKYVEAQPCYSEALPLIPDNYPDYKQMKRRSDVLDELAVYAQNVETQDSLLKLSELSPEEQLAVANRLIDELKKREQQEAEEAWREEQLAQQAAAGNGLQMGTSAAPSTFMLNTDKSWYFYNQATRNAGRTDFQKRWGSRKLEDDWRRRNKTSVSIFGEDLDYMADMSDADSLAENGMSDSIDVDKPDLEALEHASDPHYPEYYLNQIPKTDAEKVIANDVIQEGLYNMGLILKDKLSDFSAAEHEWDRLLHRYPDNIYRLDVYYNMYLMYMRQDDDQQAQYWRAKILSDFPESKYGEALRDPQYMEKLRRMPEIEQSLYDEAYAAYMADDNSRVHQIYSQMRADYPMSRIMPKFMFIDALSYVTENKPEKFAEVLHQLVERYPDTDVSPLAKDYLKLLASGRPLNSSGGNVRGIKWTTRLGSDSLANVYADSVAQFDFESDGPQLVAFIYNVRNVNPNLLLFDVARFNFSSFMVRDFDLEQMRFGDLGLLVVSGFANQAEQTRYRTMLERPGGLKLPSGVVPLLISKHNFDILINQGRDLREYFDAAGDKRLEQIHSATLPAGEYPSADEMYAPDAKVPDTKASESQASYPDAEHKGATIEKLAPLQKLDPAKQLQQSDSVQKAAPVQKVTKPEPEYEYDIPVPLVPVGKPPVPRKAGDPDSDGTQYHQIITRQPFKKND